MVDGRVFVLAIASSGIICGVLSECLCCWTVEVAGVYPLGELRIVGRSYDLCIEIAVYDRGKITELRLGDELLYKSVHCLRWR